MQRNDVAGGRSLSRETPPSASARSGWPPHADAPAANADGGQPARIAFDLPGEPRSAAAARSRVTRALGAWRLDHLRDDAALLVSEAVTSAIREGAGREVRVQVSCEPGWLRFLVQALSGPAADRVVRLPDLDDDGRGLFLVEALAARWGVETPPAGRLVWFDLPIAALS